MTDAQHGTRRNLKEIDLLNMFRHTSACGVATKDLVTQKHEAIQTKNMYEDFDAMGCAIGMIPYHKHNIWHETLKIPRKFKTIGSEK